MKSQLLRLGPLILAFTVLLAAAGIILYSLAGPSPGKKTLVCGPYERGGSIYRIGSTGERIESCIWTVAVLPPRSTGPNGGR